jgi:hypothetical protein
MLLTTKNKKKSSYKNTKHHQIIDIITNRVLFSNKLLVKIKLKQQ